MSYDTTLAQLVLGFNMSLQFSDMSPVKLVNVKKCKPKWDFNETLSIEFPFLIFFEAEPVIYVHCYSEL